MTENERIKIVRRASVIALSGNALIFSAKIAAGLISGSLSVLGDGIDSGADIAIAVMTFLVSFVISRPSDKEYPWGHQRAETIASLVLSFLITTAGFQLFLASIKKIVSVFQDGTAGQPIHLLAVIVTLASITVKLLLALNQFILGKKANSMMISANAKNMANDIILSASVLAGLALSHFFKLPYIDCCLALFISCWIMKGGIGLFIELNVELMDGNTNKLLYKKLFESVASIEGAYNPHRARIRKMANLLDIDIDIEVNPSMTVCEAHIIAEKVASAVKENMENVYDIMIHIEPHGIANEEDEGFGLCENDIFD